MGKGNTTEDTDNEDSTEMTLKEFNEDSEMTLKDLLDLDLSLYDQASSSTYLSATFDSDTVVEEEDARKSSDDGNGEPQDNKSMLQFIKQMMARERDAKYDMIETLHEQIVLLKEQLTHKQGIIDSLLDAHCNACAHTAPTSYTLPIHPSNSHHANADALLGVKTLLENEMSRNVAQVEYHTSSPKHVKSLRPVSEILTDIRDLIESRSSPQQPAVEEQKVYRIRFKLDGDALVEEQTTHTPCKMRFTN